MWRRSALFSSMLIGQIILGSAGFLRAENSPAKQAEFFESKIRPILIDQCYECHNSADSADGGLAVDSRPAFLKGGEHGAIIVPGKPQESRLLAILRHEVEGLKMPQGKGKLPDQVIADFEAWIAAGAFDPRDKPPTPEELAKATSWDAIVAKRKSWWSFQPIRNASPPAIPNVAWAEHPVDAFIFQKLQEKGLQPVTSADSATLVRRLFFVLTGLPPTPAEAQKWTQRLEQQNGLEELTDELLARPQFGERWARHWMDWLRYAESHGSEGDPAIDNIWQYRDYLIRALNADVPYDQLVREHIAGDLLEQPRINRELGFNESAIGPAHWRMVFHGFAPTDALDEKVRFIDDEINTFTKAFLGLTVSCARCHDHKFDPISQRDYYSLFGILGSCRPARTVIDLPEKLAAHRSQLTALKPQIKAAVAGDWLATLGELEKRLNQKENWQRAEKPRDLLFPLGQIQKAIQSGMPFQEAWSQRISAWKADRARRAEFSARNDFKRWNLAITDDYQTWFKMGTGLPQKPAAAGEFSVSFNATEGLQGIYPAGVFSHLITAKDPARLTSAPVHLDGEYELWVRGLGMGGASVRYVVQDYPRDGTVFPVRKLTADWQWERLDMSYWNGDDFHVELAAGPDAPLLVSREPRSWLGVRDVMVIKKGQPQPTSDSQEVLDPVFQLAEQQPPKTISDLASLYTEAIKTAVEAWRDGSLSDAQSLMLDSALKQGILNNSRDGFATAKPLLAQYQELEAQAIVPTRVPGLDETVGHDQPLFVRGNHKQPGEIAPRGFIAAIDPQPYLTKLSGRRELAESILHPANPLTRRVIVNRLWHHLTGAGIVATPDNLGRLGTEPTHPELLDYLATRFSDQKWSLKSMIRLIVLSKTWQLSSQPSDAARQSDPANLYLSHARVHRLEAEAIRDSLLQISDRLDKRLYGPPEGGRTNRRSLYVAVNRNSLDPFLRAFDFPEPFSATGRRDATNVPAQSLVMMNDDLVTEWAAAWATRSISDQQIQSNAQRIQQMFLTAFGRPATAAEVSKLERYAQSTKARLDVIRLQAAKYRQQITQHEQAIRQILEPARGQLLEQAKAKPNASNLKVPTPIGRWEFEADSQDAVGKSHAHLHDGARLENGMLVVNQTGYVLTEPLAKTIKEKTLEAWVQLDNLDQRGGGVMTLQSRDGVIFDSIVFAEQNSRQWLAGSNFFQRTQTFDGPLETDANSKAVHVAISYHSDGTIAGYRDGQPYGKPYKSSGPQEFKAGETVVGFGIRHLPAGGNRMLAGRILRAQLYDRALSAEEIQATAQSAPYFVSDADVLAALPAPQRETVLIKRDEIQHLEQHIRSLGTIPDQVTESVIWTEIARTLFTLQELIYIR